MTRGEERQKKKEGGREEGNARKRAGVWEEMMSGIVRIEKRENW